MDLLRKPNDCNHEMDPKTAVFDKCGRRGVCLKCGIEVVSWRTAGIRHAAPGKGKKHMSKKERRRVKRAASHV